MIPELQLVEVRLEIPLPVDGLDLVSAQEEIDLWLYMYDYTKREILTWHEW